MQTTAEAMVMARRQQPWVRTVSFGMGRYTARLATRFLAGLVGLAVVLSVYQLLLEQFAFRR